MEVPTKGMMKHPQNRGQAWGSSRNPGRTGTGDRGSLQGTGAGVSFVQEQCSHIRSHDHGQTERRPRCYGAKPSGCWICPGETLPSTSANGFKAIVAGRVTFGIPGIHRRNTQAAEHPSLLRGNCTARPG